MKILLLNDRINAHRDGHETKGDMRGFQLTGHSSPLSGGGEETGRVVERSVPIG